MKRRDLRPGDLFVFLDSPPWTGDITDQSGLGTILVAADIDSSRAYAGHKAPADVPSAYPHPRPHHFIGEGSLDREVLILRTRKAIK